MIPPQNNSNVIYHITCKSCQADYVGETGHCLKYRLAEHNRPRSKNSTVQTHVKETGHQINWDKTAVLDVSDNWFERGVREAMHIYSNPASLNRDSGRHDLPSIYYKLLLKPGEDLVQGPFLPPRVATNQDEDEDEDPPPPPLAASSCGE